MTVADQIQRLIDLDVPALSGHPPAAFRELAADLPPTAAATVAIHPGLVTARRLTPLLTRAGKPGFVVVDMPDLDEFVPTPDIVLPDRPLYLLQDVERGDVLQNWSPEEAAPEIADRGRTPLTLEEGISWLLQSPEQLEPGHCFMCIASRKPKPTSSVEPRTSVEPVETPPVETTPRAYDARTPAIWISGGTGRDGRERRGAPKVGWCWWRNHHTWLGFASAAGRVG